MNPAGLKSNIALEDGPFIDGLYLLLYPPQKKTDFP